MELPDFLRSVFIARRIASSTTRSTCSTYVVHVVLEYVLEYSYIRTEYFRDGSTAASPTLYSLKYVLEYDHGTAVPLPLGNADQLVRDRKRIGRG